MAEGESLGPWHDAIGIMGGCCMALSLVPQILQLLLTRNAADVSLLWAGTYLLGCTATLAYLGLIGATAAFAPECVETTFALTIICIKFAIDWGLIPPRAPQPEADPQPASAAAAEAEAGAACSVRIVPPGASACGTEGGKPGALSTGAGSSSSAATSAAPSRQTSSKSRLPWWSQTGINHAAAIVLPAPPPRCCAVCGAPQPPPQRQSRAGLSSFFGGGGGGGASVVPAPAALYEPPSTPGTSFLSPAQRVSLQPPPGRRGKSISLRGTFLA